jgi:predicted transcriptional regulator
MEQESTSADALLNLTADIVSAHVANNNVAIGELPGLIGCVHASLAALGDAAEPAAVRQEPAVSIKRSVKPDYIICLEDGKKMKMLKRHLMTGYQLTPDQYRAKWNLPADYPMVAPNYTEQRRALAKQIGLGRKPTTTALKLTPAASKKAGAPRKKLSVVPER